MLEDKLDDLIIAINRLADVLKTESVKTEPVVKTESVKTESVKEQPVKTEAEIVEEKAEALAAEVLKEVKAEEPKASLDDVKDYIRGVSPEKRDIIKECLHSFGVAKASDLKPEQYAPFITACKELV